jgi:glycosyltransferase involved in cell wall biosynthesis
MFSDVAVIIPAYNESQQLVKTVESLSKNFSEIIVVDDGSTDDSLELLRSNHIFYLHHSINLGQGAAIQTGLNYAMAISEINYFLTFDGDGQHSVDSAIEILEEIKKLKVDIVTGSRFLANYSNQTMPTKKKLILKLGIWFTRFDTNLPVTDTHNGLRVMSRNFVENLSLRHSGMAHASEILRHIKISGASWKEYPVQITYSKYSKKKGQSILNAVNILTEMINK